MSESPSEQHLEDIPLNFCSDKRFELIREPISSFYLFLDDIPPVVPVIKSPNKSTRPASTYDKHLKEDVVLKRVYYCQELVPLMVDDLRAFLLTLKESDGPLPQLSGHKIYSTRVKKLRCEEDVVKAFGYSIGFPATDMAEACVNLIPSEDAAAKVGIEFDMDEIRPKAIADNVWYLVSKSSSNSLTNRDESKRAIALVEYKSGSVGDAEFFQELITYAQQNPTFQWEFCDADWGDPKHGITHPSCDDDSDAKIVTKITSSVKTVESDSQTDPTFITSSQEKVMKVLQQVWAQACKHDLTIFMLSTYQRSVFMIRQRKTQTLFVSTVVESDPSSWNPTEATLAMIHLAYVDWRHRPSRSSSDQIRASNVVDDDLDDQDKDEGDGDHEEPSCDTDPPAQPSRKRKGSRKRGSGRRGRPRKKGRGAKPADENLTTVLLYFRYGIYQSVRPALLRRRQPSVSESLSSIPPSRDTSKTQSSGITSSNPQDWSKTPSAFIYALAGEGSGGDVWRANLVMPSGSKHRVVVKIGGEVDLHQEQVAYEHLASHAVAGVPKFLGSFSEVGEDRVTYIILEDAGSPIDSVHSTENKWMSVAERDNIIKSLKSIHELGVIHGDIRPSNFLQRLGPDGTRNFTIIDFHLARIKRETKGKSKARLPDEFRKEVNALEEILAPWVHETGGGGMSSNEPVRKE